jgi:hypothetical protein
MCTFSLPLSITNPKILARGVQRGYGGIGPNRKPGHAPWAGVPR